MELYTIVVTNKKTNKVVSLFMTDKEVKFLLKRAVLRKENDSRELNIEYSHLSNIDSWITL